VKQKQSATVNKGQSTKAKSTKAKNTKPKQDSQQIDGMDKQKQDSQQQITNHNKSMRSGGDGIGEDLVGVGPVTYPVKSVRSVVGARLPYSGRELIPDWLLTHKLL